jgi:hypothetical protein
VIHLLANGPGNVTAGGGLANTDYYDPTYVSQASLLNQDNSFLLINLPSEVSANSENGVWVGFRCGQNYPANSYDASRDFVVVRDANQDIAFQTVFSSSNANQNLSVFNAAGSSVITSTPQQILSASAGVIKYDLHYYAIAGNVYCDLYRDGIILMSVGPLAGVARGVKTIALSALGTNQFYNMGISEIVVADEDTRGMRVSDKNSLSAGTNTDWTGTVDSLSSDTIGDLSTFAYTNGEQPPLTGVRAIAVNAQMAADGGDVQVVLRKGGVDYKSGALNANATPIGLGHVWNSDPSGGSFGTLDDLEALEFGVEHIA